MSPQKAGKGGSDAAYSLYPPNITIKNGGLMTIVN